MDKRPISLLLAATLMLSACSTSTPVIETAQESIVESSETTSVTATQEDPVTEIDLNLYEGMTAEQIVATMTLEQKAAQMVQGAFYNVSYDDMQEYDYGSLFHQLGGWPSPNADEWRELVNSYQEAAMQSESPIPYIFGQDSVHGINYASGCVIFPQNINIGAANDIELTQEYGQIVGSEMIHTGMIWNFGPVVSNSTDPRWGRTYECYSSEIDMCDELSLAFVGGMLSEGVVVCPKHFFAEGYVVYGTGEDSDADRLIDRGNSEPTDEQIEQLLGVYEDLVNAGAQTIMVSHISLRGTKMHETAEYLQYLKNDLGFDGFIVSDWDSIEKCSGDDLRENVIICVNAGIDMLMEWEDYEECRQIIIEAVQNGDISEERVDDAVTRIIRVKLECGLFDDPYIENFDPAYDYNSDRSHEVARTLAAESLVPLKLGDVSQIEPGMRVYVTGPAADDTGVLCGGWTYFWLGATDADMGTDFVTNSNTILEALEEAADEIGFEVVTDPDEISTCDMVLLCIGEAPYAEWYGDTESLDIVDGWQALDGNAEAIEKTSASGLPTLTLIVAGRNMIISDYIDEWDSCIMCYLPGSEGGNAIADVITGQVPFSGTLPMPYYESESDIRTENCWHEVGWSAAN